MIFKATPSSNKAIPKKIANIRNAVNQVYNEHYDNSVSLQTLDDLRKATALITSTEKHTHDLKKETLNVIDTCRQERHSLKKLYQEKWPEFSSEMSHQDNILFYDRY